MPSGIIKQKHGDSYTVRLLSTGGRLEAAHMKAVAAVAEQFAAGFAHLTVRQGIEIPDVPASQLDAVLQALKTAGVELGLTGRRVRGITACPGATRCRYGQMDAQALAAKLHSALHHRDGLPAKFKMAVSGCPNGCTKPAENDLGVVGTAKGYRLLVGGKMGRRPRTATALAIEPKTEDQVVAAAGRIIDWFADNAGEMERFGDTIDRLGLGALQAAITED